VPETFLGVKGSRHIKLTNFTAICEPIVEINVGASTSQNPVGLYGLLQV
jgi:hypothetical protein